MGMSREEILAIINKYNEDDTLNVSVLKEFVNKIYDDFDKKFEKEQKNNLESETAKSIIIKELKSRTCDNCKHLDYRYCNKLGIAFSIGGCIDYFEPKDNQ